MAASTDVFLISTAGEDHPINYATSRLLIRILQRKHYHVFYDKLLAMPSNFAIKYDEEKVSQMLSAVNSNIPQIAQEITGLTPLRQTIGLRTKIMAFIGRAEWFGAVFIRIRFGWHCGLCMRCLYLCPQHAIQVHRPFRFIRFDTWYQNENLQPGRRR